MKPKDEIERLARTIRFEPDAAADRRILSAAEMAMDRRPATPIAALKRSMWQRTTKASIVKLSAAAVLAVGIALIGNTFLRTSHVVWASVLDKVNSQNSYRSHAVCHFVEVDANGASHSRQYEFTFSISKEHGRVRGTFVDGKLDRMRYMLFKSGEYVSIEYASRQYYKKRVQTEGAWERFAEGEDPRQLVAKALKGQYVKLDPRVIDGRVVEGIEISDPSIVYASPSPLDNCAFVLRLWVDPKTRLPVRVESTLGPYAERGVTVTRTAVIDQLEWGVELPPDFFVLPSVPEGFEVVTDNPD
jgi:hypothetical protein